MSSSPQTDFYVLRAQFFVNRVAARERFPFEMHFKKMSCQEGVGTSNGTSSKVEFDNFVESVIALSKV